MLFELRLLSTAQWCRFVEKCRRNPYFSDIVKEAFTAHMRFTIALAAEIDYNVTTSVVLIEFHTDDAATTRLSNRLGLCPLHSPFFVSLDYRGGGES